MRAPRLPSARMHKPPSAPLPRSRPEGLRWLRADGTPNWSQRVHRFQGAVARLSSTPAITITKTATIMEAAELMHEKRVRGLVVEHLGKPVGVLMASDLVNYLGGGHLYRIVVEKHGDNVYTALRGEYVKNVMNSSPVVAFTTQKLEEVLEVMVSKRIGFMPVVDEKGDLYGVLTEHDVVKALASLDEPAGVAVETVATSPIVAVSESEPLKRALELMTSYGFRRVVVVDEESRVVGAVTSKSYVSLFGSHRVFRMMSTFSLKEVLSMPAKVAVDPRYSYVSGDADIVEACRAMAESGLSWLLVVRGDEVTGIVTERDMLIALALEEL
ncbi:MAG: CBS domain-containing protein [Acidilobaceae archaeon]